MDRQFTFEELHAVVAALRGENGCPWDKAQTHESMKGNTIEEAYEVNQAVSDLTATGNPANLCEELGDLLLQVMLHSQIAEESGEFTLEDVIDGITRKMIRRHPHVFGGETYASDEERRAAWEAIKEQEHREAQAAAAQSQSGDAGAIAAELANVPAAFPALIRSQKVLKKAGKRGLIALREEEIFKEILESVVRLQQAAGQEDDALSRRLGETLFAVNKLAALYNLHSEMALTEETERFIKTAGQLPPQ
ncbi:MAG TPA: MazG family protein [Candidatus Anaerobutyricum stercoripullorum]|uniref:MazG family protein n=1 Tax=Candidatus Anaerobutyricum stercoripullorum TaxID=2838456 RepID=A0A9D1X3F0_9FIRM|nr:MazG family protein [Candidatus Anaerobutyricum stercoripullorum]